MRELGLTTVFLALLGCTSGVPQDVTTISVKEIRSAPDDFDGKEIYVRGYVRFAFEACTVSDSDQADDFLWYWPQGNCYDLRSTTQPKEGTGVVHGTLDLSDGGHLGVSSNGAIRNAEPYWN